MLFYVIGNNEERMIIVEKSIEWGPIRPVAEANSLIIRLTRGCPWNRCAFCTSYKSKNIEFSIRTVDEIKKDIDAIYERYKDYGHTTCFLQDGDVFCMETETLIDILCYIKKKFPNIKKITSYGVVHQMAKKSYEELQSIYKAGLNRVYCGMESGSDHILRLIQKGLTSKMLIHVGKQLKDIGIELSFFIVMGIGGRTYSKENALETARVLNAVNPDFIRVRTIRVKPDSKLENMVTEGKFIIPTETEMVQEQLEMLRLLDVDSYYSNDHSMNLLMEVEGQLGKDKNKLIQQLEAYLNLDEYDQKVFHYGIRLFMMKTLNDLNNQSRYQLVEEKIKEIHNQVEVIDDALIMNHLRVIYTSS